MSLAITYFDLKCPADAIKCYMEELEIMEHDNYKEVSFHTSNVLWKALQTQENNNSISILVQTCSLTS